MEIPSENCTFAVCNRRMDLDEDLTYLNLICSCLWSTSPWGRAGDVQDIKNKMLNYTLFLQF